VSCERTRTASDRQEGRIPERRPAQFWDDMQVEFSDTSVPRRDLLRRILRRDGSLPELRTQLATLSWDWDEPPLVVVTRAVLLAALNDYLDGAIPGSELEQWADVLEARDDVGYAPEDAVEELRQVIFEIANPLINVAISPETAITWIQRVLPLPEAGSVDSFVASEAEFWSRLEYRVTAALGALGGSYLACDGFSPNEYRLDDVPPSIVGRAWMLPAGEWTFILVMPSSFDDLSRIDWKSLFPPADATGWLTVDAARKLLIIDPSTTSADGR
jgi:hypothetical protein